MTDTSYAAPVVPLYPRRGGPVPLCGLYLDTELPDRGRCGPWVYSNFVATLDGRIALADPETGRLGVPASIADPRDWRLFQELAARADIIISSGRYFRDLRLGAAQDVLPLSSAPDFRDLHGWRREHAMPPQPHVAILSAGLDFRLPEALFRQGRQVIILTTSAAPAEARARHEAAGASVVAVNAGDGVAGDAAMRHLGACGYRRAYSVTGPYVLRTLLAANALDDLFLTQRYRLVGGDSYRTITEGPLLRPPVDGRLESLYLDADGPDVAQQFARFTLESRPGSAPADP